MVAVLSSKENKSSERRLTDYLKKQGLDVWSSWTDTQAGDAPGQFEQMLEQFDVIVLLLSPKDLTNNRIRKFYATAYDRQKPIVLFLTGKFDDNLTTWFFLENHDYVNGFDVSFDKAAQALKELIDEILAEQKDETQQTKSTQAATEPKSRKTWLYVAAIAVLAVIAILVFKPNKTQTPEQQTITQDTVRTLPLQIKSSNPEDLLVGTWRLVDYSDNIPRQGQDLQQFLAVVNDLKKNFELTFYPDHTFLRKGFSPGGDKGYWSFDKQKNVIILSTVQNQPGDQLKILTLNQKQLIFEVANYDPQQGTIVVRFTLERAQN